MLNTATKTLKCRFCADEGRHYVGGSQWVCLKHYLVLVVPPEVSS